MISAQSSLVDVAFEVCTALDSAGIVAVLVGGSAANYYAPQKYQSDDVDFVIQVEPVHGNGRSALRDLGFEDRGGVHVHPQSRFTLEFPAGPLAVGAERITAWETSRRGTQVLYVISRTDCVRDRLAAFYFWGDAQSLYTAVDVARSGKIDLAVIERWSEKERQSQKFRRFSVLLNE